MRAGQGPNGGVKAESTSELDSLALVKHLDRLFARHPEVIDRLSEVVDGQHVGPKMGAPRMLSVRTLVILMIASAVGGQMLVAAVYRLAGNLTPALKSRLGIAPHLYRGKLEPPSERQVRYLFDLIVNALEDPATGALLGAGAVHLIDEETGEILDTRAATPIEVLGRDLLAVLWRYYHIPAPRAIAVDSYPIPSHFAHRSMGGEKYVDVEELARICPATATASPVRDKLRIYYREWAAGHLPSAPAGRRRIQPQGPQIPQRQPKPTPGEEKPKRMKRAKPGYPWADEDGRIHHSPDGGAGDTYRGAGTTRKGAIEHGRDRHIGVATGALPNGHPYPPLPIGYSTALGGSDKRLAALWIVDSAQVIGPLEEAHFDKGYTAEEQNPLEKPLIDRGVKLGRDLTVYQIGVATRSDGVIDVDGWVYTEAMPSRLQALPKHEIDMTSKEHWERAAQFDERIPYAARFMSDFDSRGRARLRMPGVAEVKRNSRGNVTHVTGYTVRCRNNPHFALMDRTVPLTNCVKGKPCACNKTITLKDDELPSGYDPILYGTTAWYSAKGRRSNVESSNAREEHHIGIGRHSIRVHDRGWDLAFFAITIASFILLVYNWVKSIGGQPLPSYMPGDPLPPAVFTEPMTYVATRPEEPWPPPDK